jgi:hypothetical protein
MTEDEARTKLCHVSIESSSMDPFIPGFEPDKNRRRGRPVFGGTCVASDCMAWRFSYNPGQDGFCGLAGGTNASFGAPPGEILPPTPPTPS